MRKPLEGPWTLLSLTMHDASGRSASIDADGQLVSDAFGNMECIRSRAAAKKANPFALEHVRYYTLEPDGTLRLDALRQLQGCIGERLEEGLLTSSRTPFR